MAQPPLPKFTLDHDERKGRWELTNDKTNRIIKSFGTNAAALKGGALHRAVGRDGGSVKIQKGERPFPRRAHVSPKSRSEEFKGIGIRSRSVVSNVRARHVVAAPCPDATPALAEPVSLEQGPR
jgi:hypothetical protein